MSKSTLTIGIPVYNEGSSIAGLLSSLLRQKFNQLNLLNIVVYSDGSTDNTVSQVKTVKSRKIDLIENKNRQGIAAGINTILTQTKTDVLVILNGDIAVTDPNFINKLTQPILAGSDLTSCTIKELPPQNFVAQVLSISSQYRWYVYGHYRQGDNFYTCHGLARAFSKKFYRNLHFPVSAGEDMYSYFYAKNGGYQYRYVRNAYVLYRVPGSLQDHQKQSIRYFHSLEKMKEIFGPRFISAHHTLPIDLLFFYGLRFFFLHPLEMSCYPFIAVFNRLLATRPSPQEEIWQIAESSKNL